MIAKRKCCRRCHKERAIQNKSMGWCRLCMEKLNKRFTEIKILPHPERYDDILNMAKDGFLTQQEIADKVGRSRTWVNAIVSRYVVSVDKDGNERPR